MKVLKRGFESLKRGMAIVVSDARYLVVAILLCLGSGEVFAQAADPFAAATGEITGYQESVKNLCMLLPLLLHWSGHSMSTTR